MNVQGGIIVRAIVYMYEFEFFVIIATLIILAISLAYVRHKKEEMQKVDELYKNNPEYKKIVKFKKQAYIITISCIVCSVLSMLYFTIHEPSLDKQKEAYKEWTLKFDQDYKAFQNIQKMAFNAVAKAPNGPNDCKIAKKLLDKIPEEATSVKNKIKWLPRGVGYEKRKKLAEAVLEIDEAIDHVESSSKVLSESMADLELCFNGQGDSDVVIKKIKDADEILKDNVVKVFTGYTGIVKVGLDYGILYYKGSFVNYDELSKEAREQAENNNKTDEKNVNGDNDKYENMIKNSDTTFKSSADDDLTGMGGISLNNSKNEIKSILGNPLSISSKDSNVTVLKYKDVEVYTQKNQIQMIISNSLSAKTSKGIHEGSLISEFVHEYGSDYTITQYGNLDLYEYSVKDNNGNPCILRFAVEKGDNKVKYISIRRADD